MAYEDESIKLPRILNLAVVTKQMICGMNAARSYDGLSKQKFTDMSLSNAANLVFTTFIIT